MITENSVVQGGYLFVHFTGEELDGEQVYMALSRDGLRWTDLSEKPILRSSVSMKGVRDPFPVRDPKTGRCFILATDLRIEAGLGWGTAQYEGSRDIVVWESDDRKIRDHAFGDELLLTIIADQFFIFGSWKFPRDRHDNTAA